MKRIIGIVSGIIIATTISLILILNQPLSVVASYQNMSISLSVNTAYTPLGYDLPFSGDIVENVAWQESTAPYAWEMINNNYSMRIKDEFTDGRVVEFSRGGYAIELQPMNLEWTNDLNQIQLISIPQSVTAQVGEDSGEYWIQWADAYGFGVNYKWQTSYRELAKEIEIESFNDLPAPEQYIINGGNPCLKYSLIFDADKDVDIYVNNAIWNESTKIQTFDKIEFKYNNETLWSFEPLLYWDANIDERQSIATLDKKGSSLYISILIPYSWLQTAPYPIYIDADVTIEGSAYTIGWGQQTRSGIFWTSSSVGYKFFSSTTPYLVYRKTTDGGDNWGSQQTVKGAKPVQYDCWADWDTPDDTGTKIHIAYIDGTNDQVRYCYLDTNGDSVGGDDLIESVQGTGTLSSTLYKNTHMISITKTIGGNIAVAFKYTDDADSRFFEFYTSPDGDTWTNEASPWDSDYNDHILLFPANLADTNDLWALFLDYSVWELDLLTYDDSGDSWSTNKICDVIGFSGNYVQFSGAIRHSDKHLLVSLWNDIDNAAADLITYDITDGSTITAKTTILTDTAESGLCGIFVDQSNDYVYVAYLKGGTWNSEVTCYYQYSDDDMATWEGETAMQADAADDHRHLSVGSAKPSGGGLFAPVWFDDDNNDLFCNTDNAVSIAASGGTPDISNTPSTWTLNGITGDGTIEPDTIYYSNPNGDTTTPSATVVDGECRFTVTNDGSIAVDLTVTISDFSGGDANMTNGNTGANGATSYGAYAWYSGMTYSSKVIAKSSGSSILYSNLAASASLKWGAEIETQTNAWGGGSSSTATMTITATEH